MLTTATPAAQELSIASNGAAPPRWAPYPTLVGTPITGAANRPPTTLVSAPSMPATQITTAARSSRDRTANSRCSPATPTS